MADLIDLDQYFGDKDAFTEALEAAKDVCGEEHPLAADVDEAYNNLYDAMMSLTRLADKSSLQAAVDKADSLDLNDYIDNDAKAALPDALEAAKEVLADETASQEAVDEQTIALNDILMGLRRKADKSELNSILSKAQAVDTSEYTAASVATLKSAMNRALAIIDDKDMTEEDQPKVDRATRALASAYNALVPKSTSSSGGSSSVTRPSLPARNSSSSIAAARSVSTSPPEIAYPAAARSLRAVRTLPRADPQTGGTSTAERWHYGPSAGRAGRRPNPPHPGPDPG